MAIWRTGFQGAGTSHAKVLWPRVLEQPREAVCPEARGTGGGRGEGSVEHPVGRTCFDLHLERTVLVRGEVEAFGSCGHDLAEVNAFSGRKEVRFRMCSVAELIGFADGSEGRGGARKPSQGGLQGSSTERLEGSSCPPSRWGEPAGGAGLEATRTWFGMC